MNTRETTHRHLGLGGATGVGVGAIVGGGILALSGTAFAATGPSAILAFALNGVIAILTALSFAEMASKFPESGGTYTFAKKVLSVDTAFMVGWVVWFASIVAAVLYALGFAHFFLVMLTDLWAWGTGDAPAFLRGPRSVSVVAIGSTLLLTFILMRSRRGGGQVANLGKVLVFVVLILGGFWAWTRESPAEVGARITPFFSGGGYGLVQAMGYTFIALQGFDLIAAVGGEVREPTRNIPRAMLLSLGTALAIYLPLLGVISAVGVGTGESITDLAKSDPESVVAIAAERFIGPMGYWLVVVAAILSMFSALQANMFAASRIARAMALDRNLPATLARVSSTAGTPTFAIGVTSLLIIVLLVLLSDVSAAGAASSLIFLLTFALAHWAAILVRQRSHQHPAPFRTPFYPAVPVIGGLSCLGLAIFQGVAVPSAGFISVVWLTIGFGLFLAIFARRARVRDATSSALEPELMLLRGKSPLVLAPIANPQSAEAIVAMAHALVPVEIGRVVALTVAKVPAGWKPENDSQPIDRSQEVLGEVLKSSNRTGGPAEVMATLAEDPMLEIARIARLHRCQTVLLGLGDLADRSQTERLEKLFASLAADIVVMRVPKEWTLSQVRNILVPVAGRGGHNHLLARLLASLSRDHRCHVTFLHVVAPGKGAHQLAKRRRELKRLSDDVLRDDAEILVVESSSPVEKIAEELQNYDLTILGMQVQANRTRLFSDFTQKLAAQSHQPLVVISSRG